jgi:mannose-6-phosphate isomerase-like protein (cupin superfamily)
MLLRSVLVAGGILAISTGLWGQQAKNGKGSDRQKSGGTAMTSQIRRVVTGKDATGKAIAITDGAAPNAVVSKERGTISTLLWVTDSTPADVSGNKDAADRKIGVPPPVDGTIFRVIEFAPQKDLKSSDEDRVKIMREMGLGPEGPTREHPRDAGMHRTRTIDYVLILSGEIDMLMDDSEVHLKAGDVLVQRATNHAWVNRGDKPCKVAFILVDAKD